MKDGKSSYEFIKDGCITDSIMRSNFEMVNFSNNFYVDDLGNLSQTPNYEQDPVIPKRNQVFGTVQDIGKAWKVSFDLFPTGQNQNSGFTSVFRISQK